MTRCKVFTKKIRNTFTWLLYGCTYIYVIHRFLFNIPLKFENIQTGTVQYCYRRVGPLLCGKPYDKVLHKVNSKSMKKFHLNSKVYHKWKSKVTFSNSEIKCLYDPLYKICFSPFNFVCILYEGRDVPVTFGGRKFQLINENFWLYHCNYIYGKVWKIRSYFSLFSFCEISSRNVNI